MCILEQTMGKKCVKNLEFILLTRQSSEIERHISVSIFVLKI